MNRQHSILISVFLAAFVLYGCTTSAPTPETLHLTDTPPSGIPDFVHNRLIAPTVDGESVAPVAQAAYLLDGNLYLNVTTAEGASHKIARGDVSASAKNKLGLSVPSGRPGTPPILVIEDLEPSR